MANGRDDFVSAFEDRAARRSFTTGPRQAIPPTWGQLKKLTQEAEKTVQQAGQPRTPAFLLLAMVAVVTCQISMAQAGDFSYWAYIPNPPLLRAVSWGEPELLIYTNDTKWMPGPYLYKEINYTSATVSNYTIGSEGFPLCVGYSNHCLSISQEAWGVLYNYSHFAKDTVIISAQSFKVFGKSPVDIPSDLPLCSLPRVLPRVEYLKWDKCRGHQPRLLLNDSENSGPIISDWSPHGDFVGKFEHIPLKWHQYNHTLLGTGNETVVWYDGGLTPPAPHLFGQTQVQGHLWKLLTAGKEMKTWVGNISLVNNSSFQVNLHSNSSRRIKACVKPPYVLMSGKIEWNRTIGTVTCSCNCTLLHCINATWWETFNHSADDLYILRARNELWIPVNLTRVWSDSPGTFQLYQMLRGFTRRSKRFVGIIIAAILGLATIAATAATAGVALHQSIQTADYVRQWHRDSHTLWQQQKDIDSQFAEDIQNLQETVEWLGDQLSVIATRAVLRCDWNTSQFCITPVPYNISEGWVKIKRSLVGHNNMTMELMELEKQISDTFSKSLPQLSGEDILQGISSGLQKLNPFEAIRHMLTSMAGNFVIILIIFCIAFLVLRRWFQRRESFGGQLNAMAALYHVQHMNKKGEMKEVETM